MLGLLSGGVVDIVPCRFNLSRFLLYCETLPALGAVPGSQSIPLVHKLLLASRGHKHRLRLKLVHVVKCLPFWMESVGHATPVRSRWKPNCSGGWNLCTSTWCGLLSACCHIHVAELLLNLLVLTLIEARQASIVLLTSSPRWLSCLTLAWIENSRALWSSTFRWLRKDLIHATIVFLILNPVTGLVFILSKFASHRWALVASGLLSLVYYCFISIPTWGSHLLSCQNPLQKCRVGLIGRMVYCFKVVCHYYKSLYHSVYYWSIN